MKDLNREMMDLGAFKASKSIGADWDSMISRLEAIK